MQTSDESQVATPIERSLPELAERREVRIVGIRVAGRPEPTTIRRKGTINTAPRRLVDNSGYSTDIPAAQPLLAHRNQRIIRILPTLGTIDSPCRKAMGRRNPAGQYTKNALPIRLYLGTVPSWY